MVMSWTSLFILIRVPSRPPVAAPLGGTAEQRVKSFRRITTIIRTGAPISIPGGLRRNAWDDNG